MAIIAGSDGCRTGWLLVTLDTGTREIESRTVHSAADVFSQLPRLALLTIDIPIGLTDGPPRNCDREARRLLGPRASSVFPAPIRAALLVTSYSEACGLSEAACGKRLSRQGYAILDRIRAIDEQIRLLPAS